MAVLGMYEFLERVSKLTSTQDKVENLRANDTMALRMVLQAVFDPTVKFLLPEGDPPFRVNDLVDQQHVFHREADKIRYFVEGFHPTLNQNKREAMFIEFLERLDPQDAKLLLGMKSKKLPFNGISLGMVKEAFPDLLPHVDVDTTLEAAINDQAVNEEKPKRILNNSPRGKRWFHNPEERTEYMYHEGTEPEGWIKGRLPKIA